MVTPETFRQIALSFQGTVEQPHFERRAFKVINRKIFATLHEGTEIANIPLPKADQQVFCSFNNTAVYPVHNKYGLQGWTSFELKKVPVELVSDALYTAYMEVLKTKPKKK
jgi:hypothetical protein